MISPRTGQVLRIATVAVFVACGVMAWRLLDRPDPVTRADSTGEAYDVNTAISVSRAKPLTVRGFVFDGPGASGLRLCNGRQGSSPPKCVGPFLALEQVDRGSFDLRTAKSEGRDVHWSPEPVAMTGIVIGSVMTVQVVVG